MRSVKRDTPALYENGFSFPISKEGELAVPLDYLKNYNASLMNYLALRAKYTVRQPGPIRGSSWKNGAASQERIWSKPASRKVRRISLSLQQTSSTRS